MSEKANNRNHEYLDKYPDAVQDVDTAYDMAVASHDERNRAAGARKLSKFMKHLIEVAPMELVDIFEESSDDWIGVDEYDSEAIDSFYEFYRAIERPVNDMAGEDIYSIGNREDPMYFYTRGIANLRDYFEREVYHAELREEFSDGKAERLEYWAQVLHGSQDKTYTPEEMRELESDASLIRYRFKRSMEEMEGVIIKTRSRPGVHPSELTTPDKFGRESRVERILDKYACPAYGVYAQSLVKDVYGADSEESQSFATMLKNPATTLGEIQAIYEDALRKLLEIVHSRDLQYATNAEETMLRVAGGEMSSDVDESAS